MSSNPVTFTTAKCKANSLSTTPKTTLTIINPEVFSVSPRAGGYVKVQPSASQKSLSVELSSKSLAHSKSDKALAPHSDSKTSMSVYYSTSRERRINLALEDREWPLGSEIELDGSGTPADNMLAVTISCVMLMAAKARKIPDEYLTYAERYLLSIKDERDIHPPNVQGILNYIEYIKTKKKKKRENSRKKGSCECDSKTDSQSSLASSKSSKKSVKKKSSSKVKIKTPPSKKRSNIPVRKNKSRSSIS